MGVDHLSHDIFNKYKTSKDVENGATNYFEEAQAAANVIYERTKVDNPSAAEWFFNKSNSLIRGNYPSIENSIFTNNREAVVEDINDSNFVPIDSFFEIAPVVYDVDNSSRKELSSVHLSEVDFPKVVYMIVDKKIELEIKFLRDFPEWEFLPQNDLNRKTIEIFFDLNIAKRSCNKDQKVLKVPNTDVFRIAAPVLVAKGISRIVCAENLIAL